MWRYSRIGGLDLGRYRPVAPGGDRLPGVPDPVRTRVEAVGERSATVVVRNGVLADVAADHDLLDRGLYVGPLEAAPDAPDRLGSVFDHAPDALAELHDAFMVDPVLVAVPDGLALDRPVVVVHWVDGDGVAAFPRTVVWMGRDSEAEVVLLQMSTDVDALVMPITEIVVGEAARIRHLNVQEWGPRVWQVGHQVSRTGRDASLVSASVALGGSYARLRFDAELAGSGADARLMSVYFGEADQMHDFRTMQDHSAGRTTSDLLFKGAVEDEARSVYSGMIKIRPEAAGCSAFQTNRNVKLSPKAWAESVPNLEIENNDVRCSHASAVGPVDEDQRYYLESRGVPPEVAERLIVLGFFGEVIEKMPVAGLRPLLRAEVAAKLDRRGQAAS